MRIKPIENQYVRMREYARAITRCFVVLCVLFGVISMIVLTSKLCSEFYQQTYLSKLDELETRNNDLEKEIERMEDALNEKEKEIERLQASAAAKVASMNMTEEIEPMISYADTPSSDSEINIWNYQDSTASNVTGATAEQFNELIRRILINRNGFYDENHPLANIGETLVKVEEDFRVSGTFLLSIFTWESGFCDYDNWPDNYRWSSNCAGIMDGDDPRYFENINECILYLGQLLREVYIDYHNYESISEIGLRYCDDQWGTKIEDTMLDYNEELSGIINLEEPQ